MEKPVIDREHKEVRITIPNGVTRVARYVGDQGCVTLPTGKTSLDFTPVRLKSVLPAASTQSWPMGDVLPKDPMPGEINAGKLKQAVEAAFEPAEGLTAAYVVTWKGRLIAERYGEGITPQTPLESWSMGKSLTATLMGILIKQGVYNLEQPAPVPEWQSPGDPRAKIRIADLLHMSSGLRIKAPQDPDYDPAGTYPDHFICTRAVSTPSTTPLRGRCSGLQTRWAGTTIAIRFDQLSHSAGGREARRGISFVPATRAV